MSPANGDEGILVGPGSKVSSCVSTFNGKGGIAAEPGAVIGGNTAFQKKRRPRHINYASKFLIRIALRSEWRYQSFATADCETANDPLPGGHRIPLGVHQPELTILQR